MASLKEKLAEAQKKRSLVRFSRRFESASKLGYVLGIGPQFFLIALVDDNIQYNGFECFRIQDVRGFEAPHRNALFVESALKLRNQLRPRKPSIRLDDVAMLLTTAGKSFPLIAIHREVIDSEVCQIGQVVAVKKGRLLLRQIDPAAEWDEEPTEYRLSDVTRVDFGGAYEEALWLVGEARLSSIQ